MRIAFSGLAVHSAGFPQDRPSRPLLQGFHEHKHGEGISVLPFSFSSLLQLSHFSPSQIFRRHLLLQCDVRVGLENKGCCGFPVGWIEHIKEQMRLGIKSASYMREGKSDHGLGQSANER